MTWLVSFVTLVSLILYIYIFIRGETASATQSVCVGECVCAWGNSSKNGATNATTDTFPYRP